MRTSLLLLPLLLAGALGAQAGQPLFDKTHRGAKESKVASDWFDKLPKWLHSLTSKNQFVETWLPFDGTFKQSATPSKFEVRDVSADGKNFNAFEMVRDNLDGNGQPQFRQTTNSKWLPFRAWPAKYLVVSYPVESNTEDADLVAFGAWLFSQKENDLANRVLTVAHGRNPELQPLIEAYLVEKNGWKNVTEPLEKYNLWDDEFRAERAILIPESDRQSRVSARERAAKTAFDEIVKARGDYRGKAPRRGPQPTKMLAQIDWEIKQYRIGYASSDFLKNKRNADVLQAIQDSIADDLIVIKDNLDIIRAINISDEREYKRKCQLLEQILTIDARNPALISETANSWYGYGKPADHGNGCDRSDGIKAAIPHYKVLVEMFPQNTAFLMALGRCYQALEDSKNALPYYNRVIAIEGDRGLGPTARQLIRNMEDKDKNRPKR